jgi:hypothetical protein
MTITITDAYGNKITNNASLNKVNHFVSSNTVHEALTELITRIKQEHRDFKEPLTRSMRIKYNDDEHYSITVQPITAKEFKDKPRDIFDKLLEFCFDCEIRDQEINDTFITKAIDFIEEEVQETKQAVHYYRDFEKDPGNIIGFLDKREAFIEIIDGALDTAYVAINLVTKTLLSKGLKKEKVKSILLELFHEVADSNLAKKKPDGTVDLKDGKIQKPKDWTKPKLEQILQSYLEL